MFITAIFAVLLLVVIILLVAIIIGICNLVVSRIRHKDCSHTVSGIKKNSIFLGTASIICIGFAWLTQLTASTPVIRDGNGEIAEGSIAELRQVKLNGCKEWISIRGYNQDNPVLLFLAGGPGGTQMAAVRHELSELEKNFVVVNWDQAGSGKSYGAIGTKGISVNTYIEYGYALTKYLYETFNQEKIYIIGESWGSARLWVKAKAISLLYSPA